MSNGILFDSSVYIDSIRNQNSAVVTARRWQSPGATATQPIYLSAVVLEELLVGAVNSKAEKLVRKLEHDFAGAGRLLVPNRSDWVTAGRVLCLIGQKYGFDEVKGARMTNDALIAMSAAGRGFKLLTKNGRDFARIAEFRFVDWEEI